MRRLMQDSHRLSSGRQRHPASGIRQRASGSHRSAVIGGALAAILVMLSAPVAAEVVDVFAADVGGAGQHKPGVAGPRAVKLAAGAAARLQAGLPSDGSATLRLDLGGQDLFAGHVDRVDLVGPDRVRVHRVRLAGSAKGTVLVAANRGAVVAGIVDGPRGSWVIGPDGGGYRAQAKTYAAADCACGEKHHHPAAKVAAHQAKTFQAIAADNGDPPTLQIMILYTPIVTSRLGGHAAAMAWAALAVAQLNQALTDSGPVTVSGQTFAAPLAIANLAHCQEVDYSGGNLADDLDRITNPSDGVLDQVPALRDQHGADLVSLLVESPGPSVGIGWVLPSRGPESAGFGFNVCDWAAAVSNLTFVHEVGHNLGCGHDRGAGDGIDAFSHGLLWQDPADGGRYRTVMGVNQSPGFQRINRFSNPDLRFNGQPTGKPVDASDAAFDAATVALSVRTIAAFRPSIRPRITSENNLWLNAVDGLTYPLLVNSHQFDPGTALSWSLTGPAGLNIDPDGMLSLTPGSITPGQHVRATVSVTGTCGNVTTGSDRQDLVIFIRPPAAPGASN